MDTGWCGRRPRRHRACGLLRHESQRNEIAEMKALAKELEGQQQAERVAGVGGFTEAPFGTKPEGRFCEVEGTNRQAFALLKLKEDGTISAFPTT